MALIPRRVCIISSSNISPFHFFRPVAPRNAMWADVACRAESGHAAAPPSSVMKSRRLTAQYLPCFRAKRNSTQGTAALRDFEPIYVDVGQIRQTRSDRIPALCPQYLQKLTYVQGLAPRWACLRPPPRHSVTLVNACRDRRSERSLQFQRHLQKFLHRLRGRCGRCGIVAKIGPTLDAGVLHSERLLRHRIDDRAHRFFCHRAAASSLRLRRWPHLEQRIVEGVVCVRILSQRHVLADLAKALDIRATGCHRNVVVGGPVKEADWFLTYILISDIGSEARRVERHVSGKCRAFRAIHALEAFEACVKGCLSPARETHQNDFFRVDARMRGKYT